MTDDQQQQIKADAETAAHEGQTPNQRCPHPFMSEQGRYWTECYWAAWDKRHDEKYRLAGNDFEEHHEERRGK